MFLKILAEYLYAYAVFALFFFMLPSCETKNDTQEKTEPELQTKRKSFEEIKKDIEKEVKKAQKDKKEKIRTGDTLALSDKKLRSFLPKFIAGYKPEGDFVGSPMNLSGKSYSSAEQNYIKGKNHLRISLVDYNGIEPQNARAIAMWKSGLQINNRQEKAGSITLNKMPGWEIYLKKQRRAELTLAISDRMMLYIIADNQTNTEFIKNIALAMDLNNLAKF